MLSPLLAEFRQTWFLRLVSTVVLLPLSLFFPVMMVLETQGIWFLLGMLLMTATCLMTLILIWLQGFKTSICVYPDHINKQTFFSTHSIPVDVDTRYYYAYSKQGILWMTFIRLKMTVKHGSMSMVLDHHVKNINKIRDFCLQFEQRDQQQPIELALKYGHAIKFDDIQVSAAGLSYKGKSATFPELGAWGFHEGDFVIRRHDRYFSFLRVPVRKVPNIESLIKVLHVYMQRHQH